MIDLNNPIRIFYSNLLHIGIKLRVKDGKLRISGKIDLLSPVYRDEIIKRSTHLIDLLDVVPPEELEPYYFRLLSVNELTDALRIAERMQIEVKSLPVNGGWLLEISKPMRPVWAEDEE